MKKAFFIAALAMITAGFVGCRKEYPPEQTIPPETTPPPVKTGKVALYNQNKMVTAYIDYDKEATIYLWVEGHSVAYLDDAEYGDQLKAVYGMNGIFLGWYQDGILYDKNGFVVGAEKGVVRLGINMTATIELPMGVQRVASMRHLKHLASMIILRQFQWSATSLQDWLESGRVVYP
jgi:hypothetical protein